MRYIPPYLTSAFLGPVGPRGPTGIPGPEGPPGARSGPPQTILEATHIEGHQYPFLPSLSRGNTKIYPDHIQASVVVETTNAPLGPSQHIFWNEHILELSYGPEVVALLHQGKVRHLILHLSSTEEIDLTPFSLSSVTIVGGTLQSLHASCPVLIQESVVFLSQIQTPDLTLQSCTCIGDPQPSPIHFISCQYNELYVTISASHVRISHCDWLFPLTVLGERIDIEHSTVQLTTNAKSWIRNSTIQLDTDANTSITHSILRINFQGESCICSHVEIEECNSSSSILAYGGTVPSAFSGNYFPV